MAEPISIQQLKDASLDVKSLEEVVNEDEDFVVTTRLGETYPSMKRSIKKLFENGGLPATPFETKALMMASPLLDGDYAVVTNDELLGNNGYYQKLAGVWVYSKYNPYQQAKDYTDDELLKLTSEPNHVLTDSNKDLHSFIDKDYNVVASIKQDGGLHLVGLDGSVQEALAKESGGGLIEKRGNINNLTHAFTDDNGYVVMGISGDGGLQLTGSTVSVQETMGVGHHLKTRRNHSKHELFSPATNNLLANMVATCVKFAPVPLFALPQNFTVSNDIVDAFTMPQAPTDYIPINTPYANNDKVIHPCIFEFQSGFRGYRYIMAITPYKDEPYENPTIHGSHDLETWEMLTGFAQPIDVPQGDDYYLSDNYLSYDPINGDLICIWRRTPRYAGATAVMSDLWMKRTKDGITWTDKELLFSDASDTTNQHLAPSLLYNPTDNLWHLWSGVSAGTLRHYTAENLDDNWTFKSEFAAKTTWHSEVKFIGDKYFLLSHDRTDDVAGRFFFAISSDGDNWTLGASLTTGVIEGAYKATFIPIIINDTIAFDIFYATILHSVADKVRKLFRTTTNFVNINYVKEV